MAFLLGSTVLLVFRFIIQEQNKIIVSAIQDEAYKGTRKWANDILLTHAFSAQYSAFYKL